ncbi:hypothetical protein MUK42_30009 [Musa troglodytarum]|uniref:Uncharacterized protein n=1 Tax=Musa troglodytarum TaxID=320322 RepID=A0A9E7K723_9LILI|nr:hypothetical protein MUK42_30009 [Musa troglodytarum]
MSKSNPPSRETITQSETITQNPLPSQETNPNVQLLLYLSLVINLFGENELLWIGTPTIPSDQFSLEKLVGAINFMTTSKVKENAVQLCQGHGNGGWCFWSSYSISKASSSKNLTSSYT